jgi:hypothetical protein
LLDLSSMTLTVITGSANPSLAASIAHVLYAQAVGTAAVPLLVD